MIYFTADPHFDHAKVLNMCARPFANINEMNEEIIHQYNHYVDKKDTLIIAGDFAWKNIASWRMKIRCRTIYLVWGNHDRRGSARNFSWTGDTKIVKISSAVFGKVQIKCFVSHYSHCFWPASHYNSVHVYGHHHNQRELYLNNIWPDRRSMDVGVDAAYHLFGKFRPFSEYEIYDLLNTKSGHDPVDFYRKVQAELHSQLNEKKQRLL